MELRLATATAPGPLGIGAKARDLGQIISDYPNPKQRLTALFRGKRVAGWVSGPTSSGVGPSSFAKLNTLIVNGRELLVCVCVQSRALDIGHLIPPQSIDLFVLADFFVCLRFDLAYAFASDTKDFTNFFKSMGVTINQSMAHL